MLSVVELGFKSGAKPELFDCWSALIDNFALNPGSLVINQLHQNIP